MSVIVDLRVTELLAARLCHDLINPIAAINNGVELLGDEDPDFAADAVRLVGESARKASRRLQFMRFAYGFSGSGLAGAPPYQLVRELFAETSTVCDYGEATRALPIEQQKLACNMVTVAADGLPRGGRIAVQAQPRGLIVDGVGEGSGPAAESCRAMALDCPIGELTSRNIGAYFAGLVARSLGWRLAVAGQPDESRSGGFRLIAAPP